MTAAEREALLELVRWVAALDEDAAREVRKALPTAARLKDLRAQMGAEAEG